MSWNRSEWLRTIFLIVAGLALVNIDCDATIDPGYLRMNRQETVLSLPPSEGKVGAILYGLVAGA
jgi:hypothetical protein